MLVYEERYIFNVRDGGGGDVELDDDDGIVLNDDYY